MELMQRRVFVLFLTVIYTLSVFASLSFDDFLDEAEATDITNKFLYLELVILIFFIMEIFMQIMSQSIKVFNARNCRATSTTNGCCWTL
jgi:hypothetical protein